MILVKKRIHPLAIRPARNALKQSRDKFKNPVHNSHDHAPTMCDASGHSLF